MAASEGEGEEQVAAIKTFRGEGRIGKAMKNLAMITLRPEDFSSPVAFQMAISRLYDSLMKMMQSGGPEQTYVAEVRFTDDLGNQVSFAVDLGKSMPLVQSDKVKVEVIVKIYES